MYFHSAVVDEMMAVEVTATPDGTFKAGVPRRLFPANLATRLGDRNSWDVTRDGQRFLINAIEAQVAQALGQTTPPLTVVVNWLAGQDR